jgi:hypothetical protein
MFGSNATSNVTSLSNFVYTTNTSSTNNITNAQNTATWSSNNSSNLFLKAGGTLSGDLTVSGLISTVQTGEARYRLYNNGSTAEWKLGQKTSASHNFIISKVVSGVESDYLTVDTSGNLSVSGNITSPTITTLTNNITTAQTTATWGSNNQSNLVKKSGDTMTGSLTLSNANLFATGVHIGNADTGRAMSILDNGMIAGGTRFLTLGRNAELNNQGEIHFKYEDNRSALNSLNLGLFGNPSILTVAGNKKVGINMSNPEMELDVNGDISGRDIYSSNIYNADGIECYGELYCGAYTTLKGATSNGGGSTHLPYTDERNYIRGTTIIADGGGHVMIGNTTTDGSKLYVNGVGSFVSGLRVGNSVGTIFNSMRVIPVTVGTSTNSSQKTVTGINVGATAMPNTTYQALVMYDQPSGNFNDTFVGKVHSKSTSSFTLVTTRVDGSSWASSVTAHVILIDYS